MPQQHCRAAVTRLNSIWMSWYCSHCWSAVERLKTRPYTSTAHSKDAGMAAPVTWKEYAEKHKNPYTSRFPSAYVSTQSVWKHTLWSAVWKGNVNRSTDPSLLWCLWPSLLLHIFCTLLSISRSMQSRCDRMGSSKDASAKRRIQGHRHPATSDTTRTITKPGPPFIPLKVFSSVLTEHCCCTVTTNSWTSEVKSKCRTSLGLFWCRLTGLAFLLVTHTPAVTRTSVLLSQTAERPSTRRRYCSFNRWN